MKTKVRLYELETGKPIVVLNDEDMKEMGLHIGDRVKITCGDEKVCADNRITAIIDASTTLVEEGEIGIFEEVKTALNVKTGDVVEIKPAGRPKSIESIKKKMRGEHLHGHEITGIVHDIVENNLSDIELTALLVAAYIKGYDMDETVSLTKAMVDTGMQMDFGDNTVDKHCIGGVAGNRTTMLVVPIIAAAGLTMPKTSSRAITSPAGTADTMEVLARVDFNADELKEILKKTGGCIVWGGSVNLAPADDKIIRVEYPLSIDPEGQVLASVMAKKKSVGSDYLVIDIPFGKGAKIQDMTKANNLARKFIELGERLGIKTKCVITDGSSPIGNGIGPALEARDVLTALEGNGPIDLINKSLDLAGLLLEMSGKVRIGEGRAFAENILKSGKANEKMRQIIKAQGGNPDIRPEDIKVGDKTYDFLAQREGKVKFIDNREISKVARNAGAPKNREAGLYLNVSVGDKVNVGDTLFTIYSINEDKLADAIRMAEQIQPVKVGGHVIEEIV
ncbi:AMP phosphorylase [Candidatus Altiarchaeota archaeon]